MFADTQGFSPYDPLRTLFRSAPITKLLKDDPRNYDLVISMKDRTEEEAVDLILKYID